MGGGHSGVVYQQCQIIYGALRDNETENYIGDYNAEGHSLLVYRHTKRTGDTNCNFQYAKVPNLVGDEFKLLLVVL